jgi:hypothetical protein
MCDYCRKFIQHSYLFKEGYDVNIGYNGEAFIDFFNNLIVHLEGENSIEVNMSIKYCPWCGAKLENRVLKYANQDTLQEVLQLAT